MMSVLAKDLSLKLCLSIERYLSRYMKCGRGLAHRVGLVRTVVPITTASYLTPMEPLHMSTNCLLNILSGRSQAFRRVLFTRSCIALHPTFLPILG